MSGGTAPMSTEGRARFSLPCACAASAASRRRARRQAVVLLAEGAAESISGVGSQASARPSVLKRIAHLPKYGGQRTAKPADPAGGRPPRRMLPAVAASTSERRACCRPRLRGRRRRCAWPKRRSPPILEQAKLLHQVGHEGAADAAPRPSTRLLGAVARQSVNVLRMI